jgi:hypothetical protein
MDRYTEMRRDLVKITLSEAQEYCRSLKTWLKKHGDQITITQVENFSAFYRECCVENGWTALGLYLFSSIVNSHEPRAVRAFHRSSFTGHILPTVHAFADVSGDPEVVTPLPVAWLRERGMSEEMIHETYDR